MDEKLIEFYDLIWRSLNAILIAVFVLPDKQGDT
jgi:hypothetical protein